jgi:hypothetical protein
MSGFTLACVLFSIALRRLSPPVGKRASKLQARHGSAGRGGKRPVPVRLLPHCARRTRSVSAAIGRFGHTPIHAGIRTGHCSCYGRRSPSRATIRAETQSILHSRSISKAPCPCRLLRFARMRRCAGPYHRLRCRCCRYVDLSVRGRAGPTVAVVCALPTQAARAHARRPIVCISCGT